LGEYCSFGSSKRPLANGFNGSEEERLHTVEKYSVPMLGSQYLLASALLLAACTQSPLPVAEAPLSPAEIWLRPPVSPPYTLWLPDQAVVSEMKKAVDVALRSRVPTADPAHPPGPYWFQYEGRCSGDAKTIFFVGRPGKVSPGALRVVNTASIPEACHIYGTYNPNTKALSDFTVGGFNCPARF
jgi:hypothetical protein